MPQFSPGLIHVNSPKRIPLDSQELSNSGMLTVEEIRHANFLRLLDERCGGKLVIMAQRLSKSPSQVSQLRNQSAHSRTGLPRQIGPDIARQIEEAFELPRGWMDVEHTEGVYDLQVGTGPTLSQASDQVSALLGTTVPHALAVLRDSLRGLSPSARKNAGLMLRELAEDPTDDQKLEILRVIFGEPSSVSRQASGGA